MRHLLTLFDLTSNEFEQIFAITEDLKAKYEQGLREPLLPGRVMALLFEKPSLRTRVSFEAGMAHLGGASLFLGSDAGFGSRESIADFARVLSAYVDVIAVRAFRHNSVVELAQHATCSVVNALTDRFHPCQALADLYTLRELVGNLEDGKLVFVGDGNNVARSLAIGCAKVGMHFVAASPSGYELEQGFLAELKRQVPQANVTVTNDPVAALADATAVYTDVWASMGQEAEQKQREQDFVPFQVNAALMRNAPDDAYFLHCLPARRGEEVTDEVIDSPQSMIIPQAANRMHAQKGLLAWLLGK